MRLDLPGKEQQALRLAVRQMLANGTHTQVREAEKHDQRERLQGNGDEPRFHGKGV